MISVWLDSKVRAKTQSRDPGEYVFTRLVVRLLSYLFAIQTCQVALGACTLTSFIQFDSVLCAIVALLPNPYSVIVFCAARFEHHTQLTQHKVVRTGFCHHSIKII